MIVIKYYSSCVNKHKTKVKIIGFRVKTALKSVFIRIVMEFDTDNANIFHMNSWTYRNLQSCVYFNFCQYVARVLCSKHNHTHIGFHCYHSHLMCIIYWIWSFHVNMCPHELSPLISVAWVELHILCAIVDMRSKQILATITFIVVVSVGIKHNRLQQSNCICGAI